MNIKAIAAGAACIASLATAGIIYYRKSKSQPQAVAEPVVDEPTLVTKAVEPVVEVEVESVHVVDEPVHNQPRHKREEVRKPRQRKQTDNRRTQRNQLNEGVDEYFYATGGLK